MCIRELSKVLTYEFHYYYIKNKFDNNSRLLFKYTDSSIITDDVYEDKEMFDFSNSSTKQKYYDDSSKLVVGKMKDETGGVAIEEFARLKPKMCSLLVDENNKHKKANGVNKNVVATISLNEYKDVLLNKNCFRHSMNSIQSKDHRIGTYEIKKIYLSWFNDKIYILNNEYNGLFRKNALKVSKVIQKTFFG